MALSAKTRSPTDDFETFFRSEYGTLCQALLLLVRNAFEAEEIAQETMTRLLERWDRVATTDPPTGYAYRMAMNLHRTHLRRLGVRAKRPLAPVTIGDVGEATGERHDVRRALATLPEGQRVALLLVHSLDMDTEEAALALGITPGSVRARLHRARTALREGLGAPS